MTSPLITRAAHRPTKGQTFIGDMTLTRARAHEFCGPARRSLALMLAAQTTGPVFWIRTKWQGDRLYGPGIATFINPARITFIEPERRDDLLWCTEEVLRAGSVELVITELAEPPPLTPVRRLHLAAETGGAGAQASIAVLLTPEEGGAHGVESRWHLRAAHRSQQMRWQLERRRARMAPPALFEITWTGQQAQLAKDAQPA